MRPVSRHLHHWTAQHTRIECNGSQYHPNHPIQAQKMKKKTDKQTNFTEPWNKSQPFDFRSATSVFSNRLRTESGNNHPARNTTLSPIDVCCKAMQDGKNFLISMFRSSIRPSPSDQIKTVGIVIIYLCLTPSETVSWHFPIMQFFYHKGVLDTILIWWEIGNTKLITPWITQGSWILILKV